MALQHWVSGLFSPRAKGIARYKAGMAKAKKSDYQGAVDEYTAAIDSDTMPPDVRSMAIYNRSLAYSALSMNDKALADLDTLAHTSGLSERIRMQVQQRQKRLAKRESKEPT